MLTSLPDAPGTIDPEPSGGPKSPIRGITRKVAFGGGWSPERARKVAFLFDGMASEWHTRSSPARLASISDAIDRGSLPLDGNWLELGSGTGIGTRVLAEAGAQVVALDIAGEMLANSDAAWGPRVRGDSCVLPIRNDGVDGVLCVNMLLFPAEVDRVLRPGGSLVWVNSLGDQTPIHLPPSDVLATLPGDWEGVTGRAGSGFWLVARRAN